MQLVDGYRTRLTGMTAHEADAVFLAGLPGPAAELGLGTVMTAARLKVLAALPVELRARASRLVERFHLDAAGWFRTGDPVPHLPALADAVWEGQRVKVTYQRGDETIERLLDPLGLVLKGGIWYLVASAEGQVRTYRISRVAAAMPLDEHFERPRDFDLAEFWAESIATYEREAPRVEVTVRVDPRYMRRLADYLGDHVAEAAEPLGGTDPQGWLRLRLRVDWPEDAPGQLLGMGEHLEVIDPPEIRTRVARMARGAAALYPPSESEPAGTPA